MNQGTGTTKIRIFKFPISDQQFRFIKGLEQVKTGLRMCQSLFEEFRISDIYNIVEMKVRESQKIIAVCKYCKKTPSKMIWHRPLNSNQSFKLKKFQNLHEHTVLKKQIHKEILALMSNSYAKIPISAIQEYCIKKFQINSAEFKLIKKYMLKKLDEKTFIQDLDQFKKTNVLQMIPEKLKIDPSTLSVTHFPQFLFASSKKMINRFEHYGKVIFLHRFPFLIKKASNNSIDYFVLLISGVNQFSNIIFYGFSIISSMTADFVCETLINLFKNSKNPICESIFSQNQPYFNEGISKFIQKTKSKVVHLWDLLLQIKQHDVQKKQQFKKILMSATSRQFNSSITEYQKMKPDQSLKIEVFRKKSPKHCLSQIPQVFIGLGPPITHCADILELLIKTFPKEIQYNRFVFKFFDFINKKQISRYPENMLQKTQMPLLRDCQQRIGTQPFSLVLNNLFNVMQISVSELFMGNVLKIGQYKIQVRQKLDKKTYSEDSRPRISKFFQINTLTYNQIELVCSCKIKNKTGIPCCHIIRACLHFGIPVSSQVDNFWKYQTEFRQKQKKQELRWNDRYNKYRNQNGKTLP